MIWRSQLIGWPDRKTDREAVMQGELERTKKPNDRQSVKDQARQSVHRQTGLGDQTNQKWCTSKLQCERTKGQERQDKDFPQTLLGLKMSYLGWQVYIFLQLICFIYFLCSVSHWFWYPISLCTLDLEHIKLLLAKPSRRSTGPSDENYKENESLMMMTTMFWWKALVQPCLLYHPWNPHGHAAWAHLPSYWGDDDDDDDDDYDYVDDGMVLEVLSLVPWENETVWYFPGE